MNRKSPILSNKIIPKILSPNPKYMYPPILIVKKARRTSDISDYPSP